MQKIKAIANRYKIQKTLFKVNNYLYARIFDKHTLDHIIGCVYVYENEQPGQILKMLLEKFTSTSRMPNLIFPSSHVKDNFQEKSVSIFFIKQRIAPLTLFTEAQYNKIDVKQLLKMTYDGFCSLHYLHSHEIVHGNISLNTCYISRSENDMDFALNILDTIIFKFFDFHVIIAAKRTEYHFPNPETSYKDDAESLIYVILHLVSRGKMLSKQRFSKQWIHQSQLLRWKSMDFFRQMIEALPPQLQFVSQIYTIIKSLPRNQKPDYPKFIKKSFAKLKQEQNLFLSTQSDVKSYGKKEQIFTKKKDSKEKISSQKQKKIQFVEQEEIQLLIIDSDNQENGLQYKFSKLQSTKCTVKTKGFWSQKVQSGE